MEHLNDFLQHVDAMATLRKEKVEKKGGEEALDKHKGGQPEWLEHTKIWQLKEMVFKKLVDMEEYVEENPPGMSGGWQWEFQQLSLAILCPAGYRSQRS